MKVQKHPNYYQMLLQKGARIISEPKLTPGAVKGKGRTWYAECTMALPDMTIYLSASFHGAMEETIEVAEAHMIINQIIATHVAPVITISRASYVLLMLSDGVYTCWKFDTERSKRLREMCKYNTNLYCGIPSDDEAIELIKLGYHKIINW